jgi:hypothetical protein
VVGHSVQRDPVHGVVGLPESLLACWPADRRYVDLSDDELSQRPEADRREVGPCPGGHGHVVEGCQLDWWVKERQDGGAAYDRPRPALPAVRSGQVHVDRADGVVGGELGTGCR